MRRTYDEALTEIGARKQTYIRKRKKTRRIVLSCCSLFVCAVAVFAVFRERPESTRFPSSDLSDESNRDEREDIKIREIEDDVTHCARVYDSLETLLLTLTEDEKIAFFLTALCETPPATVTDSVPVKVERTDEDGNEHIITGYISKEVLEACMP